jgi:hypothetical protein
MEIGHPKEQSNIIGIFQRTTQKTTQFKLIDDQRHQTPPRIEKHT